MSDTKKSEGLTAKKVRSRGHGPMVTLTSQEGLKLGSKIQFTAPNGVVYEGVVGGINKNGSDVDVTFDGPLATKKG